MQQYRSASEFSAGSARHLRGPSLPKAAATSGFCSLHSDSDRCCSQKPSLAGSSSFLSWPGRAMAAVRRPSAAAPITAFGSQTELPSSHSRVGLHPLSSIPVLQSTPNSQDVWDVVGLGQGMVDFSAQVDDALLERLDVEKGARRLGRLGWLALVCVELQAHKSLLSCWMLQDHFCGAAGPDPPGSGCRFIPGTDVMLTTRTLGVDLFNLGSCTSWCSCWCTCVVCELGATRLLSFHPSEEIHLKWQIQVACDGQQGTWTSFQLHRFTVIFALQTAHATSSLLM